MERGPIPKKRQYYFLLFCVQIKILQFGVLKGAGRLGLGAAEQITERRFKPHTSRHFHKGIC